MQGSFLMCYAAFLCALARTTPVGPYVTKQAGIRKIPGLTGGRPYSGVITYPQGDANETFPLLVFAHGSFAGPTLGESYSKLLHTVASYGFVVVAPQSCTMCDFRHDIFATISACRSENRSALHPALATATFEKTGVFGHSLGACAVGAISNQASDIAAHNITAIVSQHGGCIKGAPPHVGCAGAAARFRGCDTSVVPIMYTTGNNDHIVPEKGSVWGFNAAGDVPRVLFSVVGGTHFEPIDHMGKGREDQPIAVFFACHVRGEHCDSVYGPSGDAICSQSFSLHQCNTSRPSAARVLV